MTHDSCSSFVTPNGPKKYSDQVGHLWTQFRTRISPAFQNSFIIFFSFLFFRQIVYQLSRATSSKCSQEIFSHHIIACLQSSCIWYIFVFPVTAAMLYNKNQINTCLSVVFICRHSYCFWNDFHAWKNTLWSNRNYFHGHALFCNLFGGRPPNCIN